MNKKKVVKADKKAKGEFVAGREMNPKTGCRLGSKGDIIGMAMLSSKDAVAILKAVKVAVVKTWTKKNPSETDVQRKAMGWIDFLKVAHATEFKGVPEAIEMSKATRAANKPVKADKPAKAKKAEKSAKVKKAAKPAKKAVEKKEPLPEQKADVNTQPANPEATL